MRGWIAPVRALLARVPEVFVYFNNDTGGAAVRDATTFMELLEGRDVAVAA